MSLQVVCAAPWPLPKLVSMLSKGILGTAGEEGQGRGNRGNGWEREQTKNKKGENQTNKRTKRTRHLQESELMYIWSDFIGSDISGRTASIRLEGRAGSLRKTRLDTGLGPAL